ncbi:hypothetical protein ACFV6E_25910 [Streptomyces sp. NPDC059785]|uniref:hypothetical protein n=1 Tax=unclassified Streptomyces TaxID=2593676 RepID=UPI00364A6AAE
MTALSKKTPGPVRTVVRLMGHELRLLASIGLWVARRTHGVRGGQGFGYARGQGAVMFGFGFVCALESACMAVLLRNHPAVHRVVLALDVYTLLMIVGIHAASVTRPHVLSDSTLRIRRAGHVDLRIPLDSVVAVRRELRSAHEPRNGELSLVVNAQTTVTLELDRPVRHLSFLGRPRDVRVIRFHADDPDALVRAVRAAANGAATGASANTATDAATDSGLTRTP